MGIREGGMQFARPSTIDGAFAAKVACPDAVPIAGGTDVMLELNFDRRHPHTLLNLARVTELAEWRADGDALRIEAAVTCRRIIDEPGDRLPGFAMVVRSVGSPQIRNRGTVGGNLGSASPAGDAHPPLLVGGAAIEVAPVRWVRRIVMGCGVAQPASAGRIVAIDVSGAAALPGVHTVEDVPGNRHLGLEHRDQRVLAMGHVRCAGEPVAIVAAGHPRAARLAAAGSQSSTRFFRPSWTVTRPWTRPPGGCTRPTTCCGTYRFARARKMLPRIPCLVSAL